MISATRCHVQGVNGSLYWDSHQSYIRLQIFGAGISSVPMSDAVATGEVNCYNCLVRFRSLPSFADTICQG